MEGRKHIIGARHYKVVSACGTQNRNTAEAKKLLKMHYMEILQEMNFSELTIKDVKLKTKRMRTW
jgi:hypothetical protein